jgi:hypothetical protein
MDGRIFFSVMMFAMSVKQSFVDVFELNTNQNQSTGHKRIEMKKNHHQKKH